MSVIFTVLGTGLGISFIFGEKNILAAIISFALVLLSVLLFILRYRYLNNYFETGIEATGEVTSIYFYRRRGGIKFTYEYKGQVYKAGVAVYRNSKTRSITKGMTVNILINSKKPKKAIIKDLFID